MNSQRDGLELELRFKREAEHKSLENLHPDYAIEKKNPFSGEKFKQAAKICRSNEETNVITKTKGKICLKGITEVSAAAPPITGLEAQ